MLPPTVLAHAYSTSEHLDQIHTGLAMLAADGRIRLRQSLRELPALAGRRPRPSLRPLGHGLAVVLDGERTVYFDAGDSLDVEPRALAAVDLYAKRSDVPDLLPVEHRGRMVPLGLNYQVHPDWIDRREGMRLLGPGRSWRRRARGLGWMVGRRFDGPWPFSPTVGRLSASPRPAQEPRVVFMSRAWDPADDNTPLSERARRERAELNHVRAECIRLLRRELGERFTGGLERSAFSLAPFGDVVLPERGLSAQRAYLAVLADHPIGVATTGLHGSIGWKLAEYVACSKAIVAERTDREMPGGFGAPTNYRAFTTADECVEQVVGLMTDHAARAEMMQANWDHYQSWVRPDRLVLRVLDLARQR